MFEEVIMKMKYFMFMFAYGNREILTELTVIYACAT